MDILSIILTCIIFGLLITISLLFYMLTSDSSKRFYALTTSAFLTVLSLVFLIFDVEASIDGNPNIIYTFITFATLASAFVLLILAILYIYDVKSIYPLWITIIYVIGSAIAISISTYLELLLFRSLFYYLLVVIPLLAVIKKFYLKYNERYVSFVFYQILVIFLVATINIIMMFIYRIDDFSAPVSLFEIIFSMIIAVLHISIYITIPLDVNRKDLNLLKDKNLLLEITFQRVKKISEVDELTGLYNRRKMNDIIQSHYKTSQKYNSTFSIILFDANDFKSINDNFGHETGDDVLIYIAHCLTSAMRESDFVARWGGDEFIALLPNFSSNNSNLILDKINNYFINFPFPNSNIEVSLSTGIAHFENHMSIDDVIREADIEMYKNKDIWNKKYKKNES